MGVRREERSGLGQAKTNARGYQQAEVKGMKQRRSREGDKTGSRPPSNMDVVPILATFSLQRKIMFLGRVCKASETQSLLFAAASSAILCYPVIPTSLSSWGRYRIPILTFLPCTLYQSLHWNSSPRDTFISLVISTDSSWRP